MKKLCYLVLILNFISAYGQNFEFAVINDKDGSANIRSSKEINSNNIIDKLENGHLVSHFGSLDNWIDIEYDKNEKTLTGFVYKDRIKNIFEFTEIKKKKSLKHEIEYSNKNIRVILKDRLFEDSKHSFTFENSNSNSLQEIDNKTIYGTDGKKPKREYNSIEIIIDSVKITLPKEAIENLYEPNLEYTSVHYNEKTKTLFIQTLNSDAAAGYAVIWVIENGKYKERIITIPF